MSKYLYQTVYEQFTGEKPPEPEMKEERTARRGHGHPYRMRHNMRLQQQDKGQSSPEKTNSHAVERSPASSYSHNEMSLADLAKAEVKLHSVSTKITYKKTRQIPDMPQFSPEASLSY